MEKILLVPDSFKGTLSSRQVCQVMAGQLRRFFPQAQVKSIPVADGGEGTFPLLKAAGRKEETQVFIGGQRRVNAGFMAQPQQLTVK